MSGTEIAAILVAVTGLIGVLGKGASYIIGLVQQQLRDTITAKNEEIELLKGRLRKAGIDP